MAGSKREQGGTGRFATVLAGSKRPAAAAPPRRTAEASRPRWRFSFDHGLGFAGVIAALGSASFAAYMINTDNSNPTFVGGEHFALFAQPRHAMPRPATQVATNGADEGVDFAPTGSIAPKAGAAATAPSTSPGRPPPAEFLHGRQVEGFALRGVRDGIAFVDGPNGSYKVGLGQSLPTVGRVLGIELRAGKWIIMTDAGLIEETP